MENEKRSNKDILLPGSIVVAALLIAGALVYNIGSKNGGAGNPQANIGSATGAPAAGAGNLADDDVILGDPKAPVTIVEFGDYQCPFCGRFFSQVEPQLRNDYINTGKAKMIYRDFAFLGPESQGAALASQCAAEQGKFWAYHDRLFEIEIADGRENNGNLTAALFKSIASDLRLNGQQFDSCFDSQKYRGEVEKDYNDGAAAGVRGTPATFINGQLISGAVPYETIKSLIEEALSGASR